MNILLLHNTATPFGLDCPWWWIFSLGAFLLGLLLGWWLWYNYKRRADELEQDNKGLHVKVTNWEKDYMGLKYQLDELQKEEDKIKASLRTCEADKMMLHGKIEKLEAQLGPEASMAAGASASKSQAVDYTKLLGYENLQIVEGIGPKVEELLKANGIGNLSALGVASVDELKDILEKGGSQFKLQDPETWPKQALLAAENHWEQLIKYQKTLDTRGEKAEDGDTPSKVEKIVAKLLGFSLNPEDLKIVEGIGPKIEKLLKDSGIKTLKALGETSVERIREILDQGGESFRLADPGTWPRQAALAAEGKWGELSEYQEFLDGGKEPS